MNNQEKELLVLERLKNDSKFAFENLYKSYRIRCVQLGKSLLRQARYGGHVNHLIPSAVKIPNPTTTTQIIAVNERVWTMKISSFQK